MDRIEAAFRYRGRQAALCIEDMRRPTGMEAKILPLGIEVEAMRPPSCLEATGRYQEQQP